MDGATRGRGVAPVTVSKAICASRPPQALALLFAVRLNVLPGGVLSVLSGMGVMPMSQVRVVGGGLVIALLVMAGGSALVACSVLRMLRCLGMAMGCFL